MGISNRISIKPETVVPEIYRQICKNKTNEAIERSKVQTKSKDSYQKVKK